MNPKRLLVIYVTCDEKGGSGRKWNRRSWMETCWQEREKVLR